jgi:hypothetical protein
MDIIETYRQVILKAVSSYEAEKIQRGKSVSPRRREDIQALTRLIEASKEKNIRDVILLRKELFNFVQGLKVHTLANVLPIFFESDLRKALKTILDNPLYDPLILMAIERAEAKEREETIMPYLGDARKVGKLLEQVNLLKGQLAAQKIATDQCNHALDEQNKNYAELSINYTNLQTENLRLTIENARLKAQLVQAQEHSPQDEEPKTEKKPLFTIFT